MDIEVEGRDEDAEEVSEAKYLFGHSGELVWEL